MTALATALESIFSTLKRAGEFATFYQALEAAGLDLLLERSGPYTVIAPTDAAFGTLVPGSLSDLLHTPEELRAALGYHIIPGRITAQDVRRRRTMLSMTGKHIIFTCGGRGGRLTVNNTAVVEPDILCSNGIIHAVGAVLVPV